MFSAWLDVRAHEHLAAVVDADIRVVPAHGRLITGSEIVRHLDMYQELYLTMVGYLNMGSGPEDAVERNPVEEHEGEFGDPAEFLYGAYRRMLIAFVPD